MIIRQSTARTILVGPVLDSTGAAKTDEVVGSIKVTKNGTVGAADGSATLTHDHAGKYRLALTANDCDTVGVLEISLNSGTNDMPVKACNVVETAIWDALFADGATGLLPANVTQIGGDTQSATDLKDFADAGYDPSTNKLTGAVELDSASVNAVADQVWDEATSGHTTAGTYGGRIVRATNTNVEVQITGSNHIAADVHEFQAGVITAGDFAANSITASALATDAVTEIQSGLASQLSVDTLTSYVDTEIAAIKAKTDNLPSDPADQSLVEAAITAATSPLATPAQVNAQVLDVLTTDTFAELSAPPAATSSLKDKITWLFMYARNKVTQTALARTLYRDDTTTVAGTSATSDNGTTFTKGEDA